jgi:hypothetical protein
MTAEGWDNVRRNLHGWERERLLTALTDDRFEEIERKGGGEHAKRAADALRKRLEQVTQDALAEACFDTVERNGTCDNGGHAVWIDREGYHTVPVDLDPDAPELY